jgi:uncharacterized protein (UPF0335 family)
MSSNAVDANHLRAFLERIERLEEEKRAIADDIKEVYAEAKGTGYDSKIIRKIVSIRRMDRDKRREEEEILELYLSALGDARLGHRRDRDRQPRAGRPPRRNRRGSWKNSLAGRPLPAGGGGGDVPSGHRCLSLHDPFRRGQPR